MSWPRRLHRLAAIIVLLAGWAGAGPVLALEAPEGEVLLTVSGAISDTNAGGAATFDRAMLEALGLTTLRTATPWNDGEVVFEGVPVARVLEAVGARGEIVVARGADGYTVEVPLDDYRRFPVLIAMQQDGRPLDRRRLGPLRIIYPWSDHAELADQVYRYRSVWYLQHLTVR